MFFCMSALETLEKVGVLGTENRLLADIGRHGISKHAERESSPLVKDWTLQHVYSERHRSQTLTTRRAQ